MFEMVAFSGQMLDAGYLMLVEDPVSSGDKKDWTQSEIHKHPVSRNQDPGSANTGSAFHHNDIVCIQYFMQLWG